MCYVPPFLFEKVFIRCRKGDRRLGRFHEFDAEYLCILHKRGKKVCENCIYEFNFRYDIIVMDYFDLEWVICFLRTNLKIFVKRHRLFVDLMLKFNG